MTERPDRSLLDDARRLGVATAARIADDLARLVAAGAKLPTSLAGPTADLASAGDAIRAVQIAAERSLDATLEALGTTLDALAGSARELLDAASRPVGREAASVDLTLAPGVPVTREIWIHNTTARTTAPIRVHVGFLSDHEGGLLDAKLTVEPAEIPAIEPGRSRRLQITLDALAGSTPGRYHGLILAAGAPDTSLPLTVRVLGSSTPRS